MPNIIIREPKIEDKESFIAAMQKSQQLHQPWVTPPLTSPGNRERISGIENHISKQIHS